MASHYGSTHELSIYVGAKSIGGGSVSIHRSPSVSENSGPGLAPTGSRNPHDQRNLVYAIWLGLRCNPKVKLKRFSIKKRKPTGLRFLNFNHLANQMHYFADVFDLVAPDFAFVSLITLATTGFGGCRRAAWAAARRAIGTRNGLQLT